MSLIEASSKACAIISTDVGGCSKICIDHVNGYLIPFPYETHIVFEKLILLLNEKITLEKYSRNSLKLFENTFSEKCAFDFWRNEIISLEKNDI